MKIQGMTILITGGSAGMGLAFARQLSERGNNVIITGRNEKRLAAAVNTLKFGSYYVCDVSKAEEVERLHAGVAKKHDGLHMLINNAGEGFIYELAQETNSYEKARAEIDTNYLSVLRMVDLFLPLLSKAFEAAIVNVSSVVAFVPGHTLPTYSASKAALHTYTRLLRYSLSKAGRIKVFELMPPKVETDFSKGLPGVPGLSPDSVATNLLNALDSDQFEIHVGSTEETYQLSLSDPELAFNQRNP
jgi:uncharacterized oxidoreductase